MKIVFIWIKNFAVLILSLFFLIIGINTFFGSFNLNNPIEFLMYFFSSSLLILVCFVGIIYFVFRFVPKKEKDEIDNVKE
jgi:ABC-type transport system involved in multi-copper enzyme maturation permease subunit